MSSSPDWPALPDPEIASLTEAWILTFCEPPPLLDKDLMRAVLAEHVEGSVGRG